MPPEIRSLRSKTLFSSTLLFFLVPYWQWIIKKHLFSSSLLSIDRLQGNKDPFFEGRSATIERQNMHGHSQALVPDFVTVPQLLHFAG